MSFNIEQARAQLFYILRDLLNDYMICEDKVRFLEKMFFLLARLEVICK